MTETYSIANDTLNGQVDGAKLKDEIQASSITIAIDVINTTGDVLDIVFKATISVGEKTTLNGIVSAHDGIPEITSQSFSIDGPVDDIGHTLISVEKPVGDYTTYPSFNFCDSNSFPNGSSLWEHAPATGEVLTLSKSEVQWKEDISFNSGQILELKYYAWVGLPEPQLVTQIDFDSLEKLFEYSNAHFHQPAVAALGNLAITTNQFNQDKVFVLYGDNTPGKLAKVSLSLKNDIPLGGSYCTASFVLS